MTDEKAREIWVESFFERLAHNEDGAVSVGIPAIYSDRGEIRNYESRGRQLFLHRIIVFGTSKADLKSVFDQESQKTVKGRLAPDQNSRWWVADNPTAYANTDSGERVSARTSQLRN